jgi:hypothetical protein
MAHNNSMDKCNKFCKEALLLLDVWSDSREALTFSWLQCRSHLWIWVWSLPHIRTQLAVRFKTWLHLSYGTYCQNYCNRCQHLLATFATKNPKSTSPDNANTFSQNMAMCSYGCYFSIYLMGCQITGNEQSHYIWFSDHFLLEILQ